MVEQEISSLHTLLAKVRSGKHQAETERAECGKLQDKMIQELQELTPSNRELTERFADCDKARLDLNCFKLIPRAGKKEELKGDQILESVIGICTGIFKTSINNRFGLVCIDSFNHCSMFRMRMY